MRLDFRERLDYHILIVVIDKWEVILCVKFSFYFVCLGVQSIMQVEHANQDAQLAHAKCVHIYIYTSR